MRPLAASLAAAALLAALGPTASAQTAPPATAAPWRPRPVIIVDPSRYLASPSPRPHAKHRPTPRPRVTRRPLHRPAPRATSGPEIFERHDTGSPPPV